MKMYLISLAAGILVGVIYSLLDVRSPAPPVVALVGLLGILAGEQIIPMGTQLLARSSISMARHRIDSASHAAGVLPGKRADTNATDLEDKRP